MLVDLSPDTLNKRSNGQWVTGYLTPPEGYSPSDIKYDSIRISRIVGATCSPDYTQPIDLTFTPVIGDRDEDGILDLTVKFARQTLKDNLCLDDVEVTVTGEFLSGQVFEGTDKIRVIERPVPNFI